MKVERLSAPRYNLIDLTQVELDIILHLLGQISVVTYDGKEYDSYDLYDAISNFASAVEIEVER